MVKAYCEGVGVLQGPSFLLKAYNNRNFDAVHLLLHNFGADPNVRCANGKSLLEDSLDRHDFETASFLMFAGADPNVMTNAGEPLISKYANEAYGEAKIHFLLAVGANPNIELQNRRLLLEQVLIKGRKALFQVLLNNPQLKIGVDPKSDALSSSSRETILYLTERKFGYKATFELIDKITDPLEKVFATLRQPVKCMYAAF